MTSQIFKIFFLLQKRQKEIDEKKDSVCNKRSLAVLKSVKKENSSAQKKSPVTLGSTFATIINKFIISE